MILLCCGEVTPRHLDALLLFAQQLEKRGHQVAIDDRFLPEERSKQSTYEMAPFLVDGSDVVPDCILVIGADQISEEGQMILGALRCDPNVVILALGHFSDLQQEINARNKIAYTTGLEPQLLDLTAHHRPKLFEGAITPLLTSIAQTPEQATGPVFRVLVYLPGDALEEDESVLNHMSVIDYVPNVQLHLLTNAQGKDVIRKSRHGELSVFSYSELPPADLLHYFDVLVFFGANVPGERMAALALDAMGAGKVVIDCTASCSFVVTGAPALRGPEDPAALAGYLQGTVSQNRLEIGARTQAAEWLRLCDIAGLERSLKLNPTPGTSSGEGGRTVFFPTNGNGLGHAQRCALLAEKMTPSRDQVFAAFPSCITLLQNRGFACVPMVPRSGEHAEEYAADVVNYLRLRQLVKKSDQLVFDGGYVFDSVYRLISRLRCPAVWIRRGLWRAGQINPIALERERAFSKVIVPTEAFEELNTDYSSSENVFKVGPIVQSSLSSPAQIAGLRERLSIQFDRPIDTLVVSMLGGGVASERTSQTQLLCSLLERRSNCLHLIVAWPNAVVSDGLYGWDNSCVIRTAHAMDLCQAADLTVSAAGYNSFHELLYARVPAILIPQSAPYLDDQERRANAAFERGLAGCVQESEMLKLEREVEAFLEGSRAQTIRAALRMQTLPEPGNMAGAKLIEENLKR